MSLCCVGFQYISRAKAIALYIDTADMFAKLPCILTKSLPCEMMTALLLNAQSIIRLVWGGLCRDCNDHTTAECLKCDYCSRPSCRKHNVLHEMTESLVSQTNPKTMMRHKMQPKFWVCNIGGEVGMTAEILNSGFARMHLGGGVCNESYLGDGTPF